MYQVWSTVLGNNLTTVLPDESKSSTAIYAGGTKIASQFHYVESSVDYYSITWLTVRHAGIASPTNLPGGSGMVSLSSFKDAVHPGPAMVGIGFKSMVYSWESQNRALRLRDQAIQDCKRYFPLANERFAAFQF